MKTAQESKSWPTGREFKGLSSNSSEIFLTLPSGPPAEDFKVDWATGRVSYTHKESSQTDPICDEMILINDDLKGQANT